MKTNQKIMIDKSSGLPGYYFNPALSLAVVFLGSAEGD